MVKHLMPHTFSKPSTEFRKYRLAREYCPDQKFWDQEKNSSKFHPWMKFGERRSEIGQELCGILGDGVNQAADLISDATSSVAECYTTDDLGQLILSLQPSPAFRRRHHQLE